MNRTASALLHMGFVLTGVVTTMLGPMLPSLMGTWGLSDAQAGYLFTFQFAGSMAGVALSGIAVRRLGFRSSLIFGYVVLALGVVLFSVSHWPFALAAVFTYGVALGVTVPATNLCVSDANPQRRSAALNWLNLAWGVGAVLCPALVSLFQNRIGQTYFLPTLAALIAALIFALTVPRTFAHAPRSALTNIDDQEARNRISHPAASSKPTLRFGALITLAPLFYLYVGTESSLSGWIAAYARRVGDHPDSAWLLAASFFWAALLAGRALAPLVLRRFSDSNVAIAGLALAALGTTLLVLAGSTTAILFAVILCGVGLASIYPITIATMSHWFGPSTSEVAPYLFALASTGGATLPWVVGRLSTSFGSLRSGLLLPLVTTALMLVLYIAVARSPLSKRGSEDLRTRATHA